MLWLALVMVVVCAVLGASIRRLGDAVELNDKLRRNDARLAAERWEVLQERHDAVIELIAQIAECRCGKTVPPDTDDRRLRRARRPRKKAT